MSRAPAPLELRRRIAGAFPAGHYAVDGFLRLLDVVLDDQVESAAVECRATPNLLLGPAFLERWCRTDEHLLMLVLHEIHHVLLGHTRLFPRVSDAQNIAFDAVINALLCHMFPGARYRGFFEQLNAADEIPGCFLRPPPGWPRRPTPSEALPHDVRELVRALYGDAGIGYSELHRHVESALDGRTSFSLPAGAPCQAGVPGAARAPAGAVLLGDHGPEENVPGRGLDAARAESLLSAVREIVEKWPQPPDPIRGRSVGGELRASFVTARPRVSRAVALLRRGFRALALAAPRGRAGRTRLATLERPAETATPDLRDRRAIVGALLGSPPLLYRTDLSQPAPRREPALVHVYLDVSGSTDPYHAALLAAVRPHVERGRCRVYAFSERVVDLDLRQLRCGRFDTTSGTAIDCVTDHMVKNDVTRALVLTDGYVGRVPAPHRRWLAQRKALIDVALTPDGFRGDLREVARGFVELPFEGGKQ